MRGPLTWSPIAALLTIALMGCDGTAAATPADDLPGTDLLGRCEYINTFSRTNECKAYTGAAWTETTASSDCSAPMIGADAGTFTLGAGCATEGNLGTCTVGEGTDTETVLHFPGTSAEDCDGVELGCTFASGSFAPSAICDGSGGGGGVALGVFRPFDQVCADPLPGEPAGATDGDVCTWQAISACTEEGRRYQDYASCDPVLSQRPYYPYAVDVQTPADDPRLSDTAWMEELDWVTGQVSSCACTCCHSEDQAPNGTSGWYLEAGPIWTDSLDDDGLAMLAGWIDSTAFGAFDPADNNGFDRSTTGLPTTDIARMQAFLEGELARRGRSRGDFAEAEPFGGPLYDQIVYRPEACVGLEGVDEAGSITWTGGGARYVYVMQPDASSPGVPPNLDLPDGTLWRLDVGPDDPPVQSGILYGSTPTGTTQRFPEEGAPPTLQSGDTYYLYVLRDIYQPITRCLFTAP